MWVASECESCITARVCLSDLWPKTEQVGAVSTLVKGINS